MKAFDQIGNISPQSNTSSTTTNPNPTPNPNLNGNITGTITSSIGGALGGVKISLTASGSKQTIVSSLAGTYNFLNLPPATYSIRFQKQGYVNQTISATVKSGQTTTKDVTLIKNILIEEYELSDWAKKELREARKVPENELVDLEYVKKRLLK